MNAIRRSMCTSHEDPAGRRDWTGAGRRAILLFALALALATVSCDRSGNQAGAGRTPPGAGEQTASPAAEQAASPAAARGGTLRNGLYAVVHEAGTPDSALVPGRPHAVLPYDDRYSEPDARAPRTYVAIDTTSWVPLILEGAPDAKPDGSGRTMLGVTLQRAYVQRLEDFTTRHLGGRVAIVLGGEVITMHKIKSVIREGKIQITRCDDNACEVLLSKLTE